MRSRTGGTWWGSAIEAPDPAALAASYAGLLEWPVVYEQLLDPAGHPFRRCLERD